MAHGGGDTWFYFVFLKLGPSVFLSILDLYGPFLSRRNKIQSVTNQIHHEDLLGSVINGYLLALNAEDR